MPAGVTWSKYLKFLGASLLSMFAGASVVHNYYKPSLTIPDIPPDPKKQDTQQRTGIQKIISIKKD